jgi:hypothetical protein
MSLTALRASSLFKLDHGAPGIGEDRGVPMSINEMVGGSSVNQFRGEIAGIYR